MKPYVCGDSEVYVPDTNCNCNSAEGISVRSPILAPNGEFEVELPNLQENLDALLAWVTELYENSGSSDNPWFYAEMLNDTLVPVWTETKLPLVANKQSENANWNTSDGNIVNKSTVYETYEVSATVTLLNNTNVDSNFSIALTTTDGEDTLHVADASATMKGGNLATAVISPFPFTANEGTTLTLMVNSGVGATAQVGSTHVFIRKIADPGIK